MKYAILTLAILTVTGFAATHKAAAVVDQLNQLKAAPTGTASVFCHDEWYCGPYGCRVIVVCR